MFSAKFDKQGEDNHVLDETELYINLNINRNLTESDFDKFGIKSPLENQKQQQEMKYSGWRFDKITSMTVLFYKTGELNGSNYDKHPLRISAMKNIEKNDKYSFIWSILASFHHCKSIQSNRVSNHEQYFNQLIIQRFNFTIGYKCSDVHSFNEKNNLSIIIIELNFYQDQSFWRH